MRVAEPAGLSIFSRPKGDVEFMSGGKREDGGFEVGYEIRHGVNEGRCGEREREREKWERDRKGKEKKRRPEMRRLKTDTVVQVSAHKDMDDPLSSSGRSLSMPAAVEKEDVSPVKLLLPSPIRVEEPRLKGRPSGEDDGKDEAQVQVHDFATNLDANPSSLDAGEPGEPGEAGQAGEDADDNDANDSDDISPGGHHHSPGYAQRLIRARRDVRRGARLRNGVGGVEMAAGRECEKEKEKEEEEEG